MFGKIYTLEATSRPTKEQQVIAALATGVKGKDIEVRYVCLGYFPENKINTISRCVTVLILANIFIFANEDE